MTLCSYQGTWSHHCTCLTMNIRALVQVQKDNNWSWLCRAEQWKMDTKGEGSSWGKEQSTGSIYPSQWLPSSWGKSLKSGLPHNCWAKQRPSPSKEGVGLRWFSHQQLKIMRLDPVLICGGFGVRWMGNRYGVCVWERKRSCNLSTWCNKHTHRQDKIRQGLEAFSLPSESAWAECSAGLADGEEKIAPMDNTSSG